MINNILNILIKKKIFNLQNNHTPHYADRWFRTFYIQRFTFQRLRFLGKLEDIGNHSFFVRAESLMLLAVIFPQDCTGDNMAPSTNTTATSRY